MKLGTFKHGKKDGDHPETWIEWGGIILFWVLVTAPCWVLVAAVLIWGW